MAISPPVKLVDYVVERFDFEVNPAFRLGKASAEVPVEKGRMNLNVEVEWSAPRPTQPTEASSASSDDREVFMLQFSVRINDQENFEEESRYRIRLKLDGLFQRIPFTEIDSDDEEDYLKHSIASGVSILYGAARNIISSMTAQSPYDKLILPSISPNRLTDQIMKLRREKEASSGSSSPGK